MHPSLTLLPLFLAAVQSKAIPFQTVTVLPIKGVPDVTAGNGFNSIANSLLNNAESVSLQTKAIGNAQSLSEGSPLTFRRFRECQAQRKRLRRPPCRRHCQALAKYHQHILANDR